jgi:hypothetical protein
VVKVTSSFPLRSEIRNIYTPYLHKWLTFQSKYYNHIIWRRDRHLPRNQWRRDAKFPSPDLNNVSLWCQEWGLEMHLIKRTAVQISWKFSLRRHVRSTICPCPKDVNVILYLFSVLPSRMQNYDCSTKKKGKGKITRSLPSCEGLVPHMGKIGSSKSFVSICAVNEDLTTVLLLRSPKNYMSAWFQRISPHMLSNWWCYVLKSQVSIRSRHLNYWFVLCEPGYGWDGT